MPTHQPLKRIWWKATIINDDVHAHVDDNNDGLRADYNNDELQVDDSSDELRVDDNIGELHPYDTDDNNHIL
jgi:hypothetical protein